MSNVPDYKERYDTSGNTPINPNIYPTYKPSTPSSNLQSNMTAEMSAASYGHRPIPGYTRDDSLSSADWDVYVNDMTGNATIAFRGTDIKHPYKSTFWRDLGADTAVLFGAQKLNNRFKRVDRITKQVIDKYGYNNVTLTGHSLGGAEAAYASNKYKLNAITYNAFVSPIDVVKNRFGATDWSNVTQNIVLGDPVASYGVLLKDKKTNIDYDPLKKTAKTAAGIVGGAALAAAYATGVGEVATVAGLAGEGAAGLAGEGVVGEGILFEGETAAAEGELSSTQRIGRNWKNRFIGNLKNKIPQTKPALAGFAISEFNQFHSLGNYLGGGAPTSNSNSSRSESQTSAGGSLTEPSFEPDYRSSNPSMIFPGEFGTPYLGVDPKKKKSHKTKHKKK